LKKPRARNASGAGRSCRTWGRIAMRAFVGGVMRL